MPDKNDLAKAWIEKGAHDLANARIILQAQGPLDTACFHCQQAVEKYLKALLAWHGCAQMRTHDLGVLESQCRVVDPNFGLVGINLSTLTPYAVELRYDLEFMPTAAETADALTIAEKVLSAVLSRLPPKAQPHP